MLRTIKWYFKLVGSLIIHNKYLFIANRLFKKGDMEEYEAYVTKWVNIWAFNRIKDSGSKVNVYGLENLPKDRSILFVSNHQSNFDILLLLAYIPVSKGFIAKVELSKMPFINKWMDKIHCLFMDRSDMKQSTQIIIEGIKQLKAGINMVVFPEGTRSKTGNLGEFKAGSFKLATKSKCMLVPLTIDGTRNVMEANNYKIKPVDINLYIHPPIDTATLTKEEIGALPEKVKSIVQSSMQN